MKVSERQRSRSNRGWKAECAVVVATLILLLPAGAAAEPTSDDEPGQRATLRIACFNTEVLTIPGEWSRLARFRFTPARQRHLEGVAAVAEAIDPDILVLSEVTSAAAVDALAAILRDKGLGEFRGHHVDGRDSYTGFDVAFVSRIPPDRVAGETIHLFAPARAPRVADREDQTVDLAWTVEPYAKPDREGELHEDIAVLKRHAVSFFTVAGHRLGLVGLHLKSNPSDPAANALRMAEAAIVRRIVRREILPRGYLPIVLGDINDYDPDVPMADTFRTTQTEVLRHLKDIDPATPGVELVNAAGFMPRVADRFSSHWDYNENGATDSDDVFTLIDHILLDRRLVPAVRRVFICHASSLAVSDHFPVVVDLDLSAVPVAGP